MSKEAAQGLARHSLDGLLDPAIAQALLDEVRGSEGAGSLRATHDEPPAQRREAHVSEASQQRADTARASNENQRGHAVTLAKALPYRVLCTTETQRAQVQRGGLVTSQFDPATLSVHGLPNVFACGEALDVDGPCGGFNLSWAWKSGMVAGAAAACHAAEHAARQAIPSTEETPYA